MLPSLSIHMYPARANILNCLLASHKGICLSRYSNPRIKPPERCNIQQRENKNMLQSNNSVPYAAFHDFSFPSHLIPSFFNTVVSQSKQMTNNDTQEKTKKGNRYVVVLMYPGQTERKCVTRESSSDSGGWISCRYVPRPPLQG